MESESLISLPVINPQTGGASRSFIYRGKVDLVSGDCVIDWKGVDDPDRFIRQKRIGVQAELYALALRAAGFPIKRIVYRLITRPTIHYCEPQYSYAVHKVSRKTAVKVFDNRKEAESLAVLQGGEVVERARGDTSFAAFENRCLEWLLTDPRRIVSHEHEITTSKLEQARWRLWEASKRILENRRAVRWMANDMACHTYNRPCQYIELCDCLQNGGDWEGMAALDYRKLDNLFPELDGAASGDLDTLTYTSMQKLALCEMLYYWRYERGISRYEADESEALWIGSAMHAGLDGYAHGGLREANLAIARWSDTNPVLGADMAKKQDEMVSKARAMVRAADMRWGEC